MSVHTQGSMANYVNERVVDVPLRILNRGPEYIRSRMMNRDSALFRHNRRSAVELLAETKPLYVRSENTAPKDETDGQRRSRSGCHTTEGTPKHWTEGASNDADSQGSSRGSHPSGPDNQVITTGGIQRSKSSPTPCQSSPVELGRRLPPPPPPPRSRGLAECTARDSPQSSSRLTVTFNKTQTNTPDSQLRHHSSKLIGCSEASDGDVGGAPCGSSQKPADGNSLHKPGGGTGPAIPPRIPVKPDHLHGLALRNSFQNSINGKRSRNNGTVNGMDIKVNYPLAKDKAETKKRSKDIPTISTEEWRDNRTDTSSELDQKSSNSSFKTEESATVVRRRQRKAISRSRSDLTKRYSNSSDFSELSSRLNRNSADLEKFFNEMGLDHNILEPLKLGQSAQAQSSSSLNLFESVSCLGSTDARSCFSEESLRSDGRLKPHEPGEIRTPGSSAIVERNARIIKWLCNIKVASSSTPHLPHQQKSAD